MSVVFNEVQSLYLKLKFKILLISYRRDIWLFCLFFHSWSLNNNLWWLLTLRRDLFDFCVNGFCLLHFNFLLQQILRRKFNLSHIVISIVLSKYYVHFLNLPLQFLLQTELLCNKWRFNLLFSSLWSFHLRNKVRLYLSDIRSLCLFRSCILFHRCLIYFRLWKVVFLSFKIILCGFYCLYLFNFWLIMMVDRWLPDSYKWSSTQQVCLHSNSSLLSIIRAWGKFFGLNLRLYNRFRGKKEGLLDNFVLIIGQFSSEFLRFKSINKFEFCHFENISEVGRVRMALELFNLLLESEGVQFAYFLWC